MTLKADLMVYLSKVRSRIVTVGYFNEALAAPHGQGEITHIRDNTQHDLEEVDDLSMRLSHMSTFGDPRHVDTDRYVAANLLAHIDKMPNNGDWHGILKQWAQENHDNLSPNECSCDHMLNGGIMPRPLNFHTPLNFRDDCVIHGTGAKTVTLDVDHVLKGFVEGDPRTHYEAEGEIIHRIKRAL